VKTGMPEITLTVSMVMITHWAG